MMWVILGLIGVGIYASSGKKLLRKPPSLTPPEETATAIDTGKAQAPNTGAGNGQPPREGVGATPPIIRTLHIVSDLIGDTDFLWPMSTGERTQDWKSGNRERFWIAEGGTLLVEIGRDFPDLCYKWDWQLGIFRAYNMDGRAILVKNFAAPCILPDGIEVEK